MNHDGVNNRRYDSPVPVCSMDAPDLMSWTSIGIALLSVHVNEKQIVYWGQVVKKVWSKPFLETDFAIADREQALLTHCHFVISYTRIETF